MYDNKLVVLHKGSNIIVSGLPNNSPNEIRQFAETLLRQAWQMESDNHTKALEGKDDKLNRVSESKFIERKYGTEYVGSVDKDGVCTNLTTVKMRKHFSKFGKPLSAKTLIKIMIENGYISDSTLYDNQPLDKYKNISIVKINSTAYAFSKQMYKEIFDLVYSTHSITDDMIKNLATLSVASK